MNFVARTTDRKKVLERNSYSPRQGGTYCSSRLSTRMTCAKSPLATINIWNNYYSQHISQIPVKAVSVYQQASQRLYQSSLGLSEVSVCNNHSFSGLPHVVDSSKFIQLYIHFFAHHHRNIDTSKHR